MDEYADIYYVDENRNAVRDHRTQAGGGFRQPARTVYVAPRARPGAPMAPVAYPPAMAPVGYPPAPFYGQHPVMYPPGYPTTAAAIFGRLSTGQIVEMVAQAFAALQSLPAAPVATRETSTDVANLILFQNALAHHAKRDEQVRTLGGLVAKLVG